jgi:hypothetical protein
MRYGGARSPVIGVGDLSWHDGVLLSWTLRSPTRRDGRGSRGVVDVEMLLYPEGLESKDRARVRVICEGVKRFKLSGDVRKLATNAGPGNVVDGQYQRNRLRIQLTGGSMEIHALAFTVQSLVLQGRSPRSAGRRRQRAKGPAIMKGRRTTR